MTQSGASVQSALTKRERFLRAIRQEPIDRPPVWLMRQAGRYLPQYQEIRKHHSFQNLCRIPEIAAEVSIQPYEILGVDAIIVFNDILIPFESMGFSIAFTEQGPEIDPAIRSDDVFENVHKAVFDEIPHVSEAIAHIRKRVGPDVPIVGFVGAPFTMASYAVEGKLTKNLVWIKALRYSQPDLVKRILETIAETVVEYLLIQIEAGVDAVQIFDTWASVLTPVDYREFALPYQKQIIQAARRKNVPAILYVNGCLPYLSALAESEADGLSVDWRVDLKSAYDRLGGASAVQGNLDPAALCAPPDTVAALTRTMLDRFGRKTGHIANLGHGVLPNTPVENVRTFVETVQAYDYSRLVEPC